MKFLYAFLMFLVLSNSSLAKIYYFKAEKGLVSGGNFYPFCNPDNEEDCTYPNENANDIAVSFDSSSVNWETTISESISNRYSLTLKDGVSISDFTFEIDNSEEGIIPSDYINLDKENSEVIISNNAGVSGVSRVTLKIRDKSTGSVVASSYFDVNVAIDYVCNTSNPLQNIEKKDDWYLLGGQVASADVAKDQLLCLSQNQSATGVLTSNYKLMTDVSFDINVQNLNTYSGDILISAAFSVSGNNEDWNGDGVVDSISSNNLSSGGWIPLGNSSNSFVGKFNGNSKTINNLYIYRTESDYAGLFGKTGAGFTAYNLTLNSFSIEGKDYVGALAGFSAGEIDNVEISNLNLKGINYVGGMTGYSSSINITDCRVLSGNIYGSGTDATGGLIGYIDGTSVSDCYSLIGVSTGSGVSYSGGLIGSASNVTVNRSYATRYVRSYAGIGGLIGMCNNVIVNSSYATGDVGRWSGVSRSDLGGFIGHAENTTLNNVYATGIVSGYGYNIGGLVGFAKEVTINNSYSESTVVGGYRVAGLVGETWGVTTINNSYAYWSIAPSGSYVGGLVGIVYNGDGAYYLNNENDKCEHKAGVSLTTYTCKVGGVMQDIYNIQAGGTYAGWNSSIWSGIGETATPTLNGVGGQ